ncbi:MAG: iron-containing alcohol dehydrogenase family protein [Alphaproteobacteria bacterium]|nr:iron-containing alcohol dehydrogenase family protein [Alphaproteobacteria bacterium]
MLGGAKITRFDGNAIPKVIISGIGCRAKIPAEADNLGAKRIAIVSGRSVRAKTPFVEDVCRSLGQRIVTVFDEVEPNSPVAAIRSAVDEVASSNPDAVLSIGGGAVHDMAKAMAVMLPSGRSIVDFVCRFEPPDTFHSAEVDVEPLPVMTMPTTFSAAEVVGGGAVTDTATGEKLIFVHPKLTPARVFLDGEVVASTPSPILAASGLNAVHHCLEAYYSKGAQPITDAFAVAALSGLLATLPALSRAGIPPVLDVFQNAIDAAALSGLTYTNSWLGIGHSVCHSLGGRYGVPHGDANAVMVCQSLRFNFEVARDRLAAASRGAGISSSDDNDEAAEALVKRIDDLTRTLGTPRRLRDLGLPDDQFDRIAADVLEDPQTYWNPRSASREQIIEWLQSAW